MINDQCRIARDRFLVYILSRCFLPFFGPDIMLPIACAARSFWLEGQSTIDHRQNVTTDPWHHSYDFKSGKQHNLNILLFHYFIRIANVTFNLKLRFFRRSVCFCSRSKANILFMWHASFFAYVYSKNSWRVSYTSTNLSSTSSVFFFFLFHKLVSSVWRNLWNALT